MARKRVAVLISGRGSNMAALIAAAEDKTFPAEIVLVVSNRPDAGGLAHARAHGVTTAIVDHAVHKDRETFERALQDVLDASRIDIVCLAGFLRLLTPWFVSRWEGRMLNIHPALLPSFKGLDTHQRAIDAGAKIHGATVHFVVPEMDAGPIVAQKSLQLREGEDTDALAARVIKIEHEIFPLALKWLAEGRLHVENGHCRLDNATPAEAVLLEPIDRA